MATQQLTGNKTPLYDAHVAAGGKMIEFAGWIMPVQYSGLVDEHNAVRNEAGIFDVSHMGEVTVDGPEAENFVQWLVSNNVKAMEDNQVLYNMMCYEDGGIVDDLLVYRYSTERYLLVINAANIDKDFEWILNQASKFDVKVKNVSDDYGEVAVQGPLAQEILQTLTDQDLSEITFFRLKENVQVAGVNCLVSRTGYTGEDGFEVYMKPEDAQTVWDAVIKAGEPKGLKPAGLGARDTLRFEATLPLYGHEINRDITPLEAGLSMFVKLDNDDFCGKAALVKQKEEGIPRKLVGFELKGKGIPREGYRVVKDGQDIGFVTTGYKAPTVGKTIGLALVERAHGDMGGTFDIQIRKKVSPAEIISKRFYKKNYKK